MLAGTPRPNWGELTTTDISSVLIMMPWSKRMVLPLRPMAPHSHAARSELPLDVARRALRMEPAAIGEWVRFYQRPVHALLYRMLAPAGRAQSCEDLAQEVFLRALQALPRFELSGPARLSTWLLTIATRLALNELRRPRAVPRDFDPGTAATADRPDSNAERRALGAAISRALCELEPEFRAPFLLREFHGLEYAEIAAVLEIELGTVKSRLSRARGQLRAALQELRP